MNLNSSRFAVRTELEPGETPNGPILALETSGKSASVAIVWPDGRVAESETDPAIGSARTLAPAIQAILKLHSLVATDLVAIAVTVGPGSFTGLRVGVATAKSMAYALRIPTIAVDSLETMAVETSRRLTWENPSDDSEPLSMIWTVMDAFRGELFAALWLQNRSNLEETSGTNQAIAQSTISPNASLKEILPSHLVDSVAWTEAILNGQPLPNGLPDEVLPLKHYPLVLTGPGLVRCPRLLSSDAENGFRILNGVVPRAAMVGRLGLRKLMQQQTTDAFQLMPVYLRGSAAEEKLLLR
jgi:tRNA threonylcarbamoyladenosine biosynthesis protein TsaB